MNLPLDLSIPDVRRRCLAVVHAVMAMYEAAFHLMEDDDGLDTLEALAALISTHNLTHELHLPPRPSVLDRHWWEHTVPKFDQDQFKDKFRMRRDTFDALLAHIEYNPK